MRDGHLWERVFAVNEGGVVRPEAAVEPEVIAMAMGYDDECDCASWVRPPGWGKNQKGFWFS